MRCLQRCREHCKFRSIAVSLLCSFTDALSFTKCACKLMAPNCSTSLPHEYLRASRKCVDTGLKGAPQPSRRSQDVCVCVCAQFAPKPAVDQGGSDSLTYMCHCFCKACFLQFWISKASALRTLSSFSLLTCCSISKGVSNMLAYAREFSHIMACFHVVYLGS